MREQGGSTMLRAGCGPSPADHRRSAPPVPATRLPRWQSLASDACLHAGPQRRNACLEKNKPVPEPRAAQIHKNTYFSEYFSGKAYRERYALPCMDIQTYHQSCPDIRTHVWTSQTAYGRPISSILLEIKIKNNGTGSRPPYAFYGMSFAKKRTSKPATTSAIRKRRLPWNNFLPTSQRLSHGPTSPCCWRRPPGVCS